MWVRLKQFGARHKKKLVVGGLIGAVGGAYLLWNRVKPWVDELRGQLQALRELERLQSSAAFSRSGLQSHFERALSIANSTFEAFLATSRGHVNSRFDVQTALNAVAKARKEGGGNHDVDAWEELRNLALKRALCTVYHAVLLHALLRAQLLILARRGVSADTASAKAFLRLAKHAHHTGLDDISRIISCACDAELKGLDVCSVCSDATVTTTLGAVRSRVDLAFEQCGWPVLLLPPPSISPSPEQAEMEGELRRVVATQSFARALRAALTEGCAYLLDLIVPKVPQEPVAKVVVKAVQASELLFASSTFREQLASNSFLHSCSEVIFFPLKPTPAVQHHL